VTPAYSGLQMVLLVAVGKVKKDNQNWERASIDRQLIEKVASPEEREEAGVKEKKREPQGDLEVLN